MNDTFFRRKQAGDYLFTTYGVCSPHALGRLASVGGGPRFHKAGRLAIYKKSDLDAWAAEKLGATVASTADYQEAKSAA